MSRYRIIHVNNTQTAQKARIVFDFPDFTQNSIGVISGQRQTTLEGAINSFISASSGVVTNFSKNILYQVKESSGLQSAFTSQGMSNFVDFDTIEVGDRFYVNRWDANHGYFQVTSKISYEDRIFEIQMAGYCSDGTAAYSALAFSFNKTSGSNQRGCIAFPWIGNINDDSSYAVIPMQIYMYNDMQYAVFTSSSYNPTSYANGKAFWEGVEIIDTGNPYLDGGETEEGGGDPDRQNWDNASDAVTPDALPTKGAMNSGMLKVFSPTETQVLDLTDLLFSYNFFDWLQKNLQNLEELFVSFGVVPFTVTKGAIKSVTFLGFDISTFAHPVYLTEASQQYYEFDMGSIALNGSDARIHASDSVFDYSPFSRLGIYLPFIGFQELDIDECRGNTINLKYRIDIISGSAVALISLNNDDEHCIYQFSGNCLSQIPLGSVDMSGIIAGSINIAVAAASAGTSGAIASAGDALTAENLNAGKITETAAGLQNSQHAAQVSNARGNLASATANGIMGMKPNYKHTGAIGSTGGLMAVKQPYLFLTTPRESVPAYYQRYCGLPCNITDKLSNFRGYTVVEDIRLNGLVATSPEVEEIYNLLKTGVII